MKEIKAYIRTEMADEVLTALSNAGIPHATVTYVMAIGAGTDPSDAQVSMEFGRAVNRMVKLEIICPDRASLDLIDVIRKAARTGRTGDGIISVKNVNRLVKILTGEESVDAL